MRLTSNNLDPASNNLDPASNNLVLASNNLDPASKIQSGRRCWRKDRGIIVNELPQIFTIWSRYRVIHKGWDLRDDCTEFMFPATISFFLQFTFLFLFSSQLKTFFFHWQIKKKQFKDKFKKEDLVYILDRKIWKVSSRLYSLNFCGQPSMWNNLKSWAFIYCLCYMSHKLNCPVLPMKKKKLNFEKSYFLRIT